MLGNRRWRTCVLSVQARFQQVIELQNESAWLGEERRVAGDILQVCPDDAVPSGRFGRRGPPDCKTSLRVEQSHDHHSRTDVLSTFWKVKIPVDGDVNIETYET